MSGAGMGAATLVPGQAPATGGAAHFEALHRGSTDPWGVHSRWYERRKRELVLASLPRERYALGFEPGCSVGGNTRALARRCDTLVACDASPAALARARAHLGRTVEGNGAPGVRLEPWTFPHRWPEAPCDLVVVAELAYYLPEDDFHTFLAEVPHRLVRGGHLLLCHWRRPLDDAFRSGDRVHAQARRLLALEPVGGWCDEDMRIDVWQQGGPTSLAAP